MPASVRGDLSKLRWLQHRLVDIMADGNFMQWLADDTEMRLEALGSDMVGIYVAQLVNDALFGGRRPKKIKKSKKAKKAKKSKKTAKRGSK